LRIIEIPKEKRKGKKLKTVILADVEEFSLDKGQEKPKIGFSTK